MKKTVMLLPQSEAEFQRQVIQLARLGGWRSAHFRSGRVLKKDGTTTWRTAVDGDGKGFPDLILLRGLRLVVLELKKDGEKCTPEQNDWLAAFQLINDAEVYVFSPGDWPLIETLLA